MKTRTAIVILAILFALGIPLTTQYRNERKLRAENDALRELLNAMNLSAAENERLSNLLAQAASPAQSNDRNASELARLRAEVTRLREENANLKTTTPKSDAHKPPIELATEIARHKLRFAEALLQEAEERLKAGTGTQVDIDRARIARDLMEAEMHHDVQHVLRLRYQLAENYFQAIDTGLRSAAKFSPPGTNGEFERARYARDLALAEMNGNRLEVARIKLEAADSSLAFVEGRLKRGNVSQRDYLEAKLARDIAASECAYQAKAGGGQ